MNRRIGLAAQLLRWRWILVTVAALGAAILARGDNPPDLLSFSERAGFIFDGHLARVYSGTWNQAGPLQLLIARALLLGSSDGRPLLVVECGVDAALLFGLHLAARRSGISELRELVVAVAAVVWLGPSGLWSGHPVEVTIPLLWLAAATWARTDRWLGCAAALGLAALVAPWAVLGWPLVFLARGGAIRATALAVVITLAGYLPFVLSGRFDLFDNAWVVNSGTLIHLLAPNVSQFTWPLRLLQGTAAVGAAAMVMWWRRASPDVVWSVPLVVVLVRILLDPVVLGYYWLPAGLLVIAGAASAPTRTRRELGALAAIGYLTYLGASGTAVVLCSLASLALTVGVLVRSERSRPDLDIRRIERRPSVQDGRPATSAHVDLIVPAGEIVAGDHFAVAAPNVGERDR